MRKPKGYEEAKAFTEGTPLPAGGYVLEILNVEYSENPWNDGTDEIRLAFDICEGEFAGYYKQKFNKAKENSEDAKWKGNTKIRVPADDLPADQQWKLRRFKTDIIMFEDSNEGFHWDWDEQKLKGLKIGGLFAEDEYLGHTYAKLVRFTTVDNIRDGNFTIPEFKKKESLPTIPSTPAVEDDLPF